MSVLRDVLVRGLRVVFCGTAVGAAPARRQAYYAGAGNAFWPTLYEVGFTPSLLQPEEYQDITGMDWVSRIWRRSPLVQTRSFAMSTSTKMDYEPRRSGTIHMCSRSPVCEVTPNRTLAPDRQAAAPFDSLRAARAGDGRRLSLGFPKCAHSPRRLRPADPLPGR